MNALLGVGRLFAAVAAVGGAGAMTLSDANADDASQPPPMATFICRPAMGSENGNARMTTETLALTCRPFAVSMRMSDGSLKVIGDVKARPVPGPDLTNALTVQQVNSAWNNWVQQTFQVRGNTNS